MRPLDGDGIITDEDRRQAEKYLPEVRSIEPLLHEALESLPDLEHDLIIRAYGLRGEGFSYRTQADFSSYDQEEFENRLREARVKFSRSLRELLEKSEQGRAAHKILALLRGET